MTPLQYTFQYNGENLGAFSTIFTDSTTVIPLVATVLVVIYATVYFFAPHIYSTILYRNQEKEKRVKKNLIQDLILMKEIQTELEKEIETSLLHAGMQKGT